MSISIFQYVFIKFTYFCFVKSDIIIKLLYEILTKKKGFICISISVCRDYCIELTIFIYETGACV